MAWWLTIKPSNERDWQKDVAVLPYAIIQDNQITIRNIRNLTYRTETDFDIHYYDKTFDLNVLDSVDLIAVYWMGDAIAHIMMSFVSGKRLRCLLDRNPQGKERRVLDHQGFF